MYKEVSCKDANVRAILSYADSAHHTEFIYRACNFNYYGLTDIQRRCNIGDGTKHSRGAMKRNRWRVEQILENIDG